METIQQIYDLIILGGGCAGLTAGIYAGRAKMRTVILENKQAGGQAATTDEIANYPGFSSIAGPELADRMLEQARSFGAEYITCDVQSVSLTGEIKEVATATGVYRSRAIILATGANPKKLGFEGEDEFRGRGVGYCATCDGFFFEDKDIFVIGGGYSAAEEALYLTRFGKKVTILVRKDRFRCAQSIVDKVMSHPKIEVRFNTEIEKAFGGDLLQGAVFKNNKTGETTEYRVSEQDGTFGIFVFVGYEPASSLFAGQVDLDGQGYVKTGENMETGVPGVFAAGDLRPKLLRQLVTATADGAVAAVQAERYVAEQKEKYGIRDGAAGGDGAPYSSGATAGGSRAGDGSSMDVTDRTAGEISGKKSSDDRTGEHLTAEIRREVSAVFEKLERDAVLICMVDDKVEKSKELAAFLKEVCSLSSHLKLETYSVGQRPEVEEQIRLERLPAAALLDEHRNYTGVKFSGIPGGHEFNSFILAIYNLAGPGQEVGEALRSRAEKIEKQARLQIAVSLSCHFCPETVAAAQRLAILNPCIEAEMIDMGLFPELRKKYNIMSVPAVILNGGKIAFGAQNMEAILGMIEKDA